MLEWWGRSKRQGMVDKNITKNKWQQKGALWSLFFFFCKKYAYLKMLLKYIWFTMWISAIQHSDSVIHIYTLFFIILFHYGLSQHIDYSPLCYTGGSCCNVKTTANMFPGSCSSTELPGAQVDLGDTILGSVCFWCIYAFNSSEWSRESEGSDPPLILLSNTTHCLSSLELSCYTN